MKDKNGRLNEKSVLHKGDEGQKWAVEKRIDLHRGDEGQNQSEPREKQPS
jgi:hypothetical protein